MTNREFERLLELALQRAAEEECSNLPSEQVLRKTFPDTSALDKKILSLSPYSPARPKPVLSSKRSSTKPKRVPFYKRMSHTVAMTAVSFTLLFGLLMTNAEARNFFTNLVLSWYEDHNLYTYRSEDIGSLRTDWKVEYLSEGFTLVFKDSTDHEWVSEYKGPNGALLNISISNQSDNRYKDNRYYTVEPMTVRGEIADVYHSLDGRSPNIIVLQSKKQQVFFNVIGDLPMEELVLILEHITP